MVVDLVGVEVVDLAKAEAGGVASQGLSRSRSQGRLFDEWP